MEDPEPAPPTDEAFELARTAVPELARMADNRLQTIAAGLFFGGGLLAVSVVVAARLPSASLVQLATWSVAMFAIGVERLGKARRARRAAIAAETDMSLTWKVDGHRVLALADGKVRASFRLSQRMRKRLVAMPRAKLLTK